MGKKTATGATDQALVTGEETECPVDFLFFFVAGLGTRHAGTGGAEAVSEKSRGAEKGGKNKERSRTDGGERPHGMRQHLLDNKAVVLNEMASSAKANAGQKLKTTILSKFGSSFT